MKKKRNIIEGAYYHVTSRTNNKVHIFEHQLGRKIMLLTLEDAKEKYRFHLANFCVMPNHIHLLIQPKNDTTLSGIMHWIKLKSAKCWNNTNGSCNHLWGDRYFSRIITDPQDYEAVMNYIDQNPVEAGLSPTPAEWEASGAFYKAQHIEGLVDL